ncbi:MAG: hypothetical protein GY911_11865 [Actinomycetales bacterium]|nr:hypothetical protein [Actinomycetales bacterium]
MRDDMTGFNAVSWRKMLDKFEQGWSISHAAKSAKLDPYKVRRWLKMGQREVRTAAADFYEDYLTACQIRKDWLVDQLVHVHGKKSYQAIVKVLMAEFPEYRDRARLSADAQAQVDKATVEKAQAEVAWMRARTEAFKGGKLDQRALAALLTAGASKDAPTVN